CLQRMAYRAEGRTFMLVARCGLRPTGEVDALPEWMLAAVVLEIAARREGGQRAHSEGCATGDEDIAHQLRMLAQDEMVHRRHLLRCRRRGIDGGELCSLRATARYALELVLELLCRALQLIWRHVLIVL